MREINISFKAYTIEELKELDENAYETAIENSNMRWHVDMIEFDWEELKESMQAFGNEFGINLRDWSVGLFSQGNYIKDDSDEYRDNKDNADINYDVKKLNEFLKDDNKKMDLTGTWSDILVFQYFTDNDIKEVTYNDIHKHIKEVLSYAVESFVKLCEDNLLDRAAVEDYAFNCDLEFTEDGEIY